MFNPLLNTFKKITDKRSTVALTLSEVVSAIRSGTLYELDDLKTDAEFIRKETVKKTRNEYKQRYLPYFTTGGTFKTRNDAGIVDYSGLIHGDIDLEQNKHLAQVSENFAESVRDLLAQDKHTVCAFISVGGNGVCVLFRTDHKHDAKSYISSWNAMSEYVKSKYEIVLDPAVTSISEARFYSYDTNAYLNLEAAPFNEVLQAQKKERKQAATGATISVSFDFSQFSPGNNHQAALKWGTHCANNGISDEAGIEKMREVIGGADDDHERSFADAYKWAQQNPLQPRRQAVQAPPHIDIIGVDQEESEASTLAQFITGQGVYFDIISRTFFWGKIPMSDREVNDLYLMAINRLYGGNRKALPKQFFETVLGSSLIPQVNRFEEYLSTLPTVSGTANIDRLIAAMRIDPKDGDIAADFTKRWLVSIIANMHAMGAFDNGERFEVSPLVLALIDEKGGAGKSYFFEHLLPEGLSSFFYSTQFNDLNVKDEYIKMTANLICFVDEADEVLANAQKQALFKYCTSNTVFDVRTPHAKHSEKRPKLAVFCAASNYDTLIIDNERNRRIIPVRLTGAMDWDSHNRIDRTELFAELYSLYKAGFEWRIIGEDIRLLEQLGEGFVALNAPMEMLEDNFEYDPVVSPKSMTQIISELPYRVNIDSAALSRFADAAARLKWPKDGRRGYRVKRK